MNGIKGKVTSFEALYNAINKCKKNVMWKGSVAGFVKNNLVNCVKLKKQLLDDTYRIDDYTVFTIYEPKKRVIVSTRFKDRVFQRSLCDNYLYKTMTKGFIYDNCACQIGKGVDFAMNRLNNHLHKFYRHYNTSGYVLKCDISNYFGNTEHNVAKAAVRKRVKDDWVYGKVCDIIDSFCQGDNPEIGMGLGSQVTQLIQLAVLDDLDHYIKEELHIKHYLRYMDDFILIHEDKEYLKFCYNAIKDKLGGLHLSLSKKKTQLFPLKHGIKFLGFHFYLTATGKVIRKINSQNVKNEKRKLKKLRVRMSSGLMSHQQIDVCFQSWKAHLARGNTYKVIKTMETYYEKIMKEKSNETDKNCRATQT